LLTVQLCPLLLLLLLLLGFTQARDPIPQLKRIMLEQGLASEDDIKAIHDRCALAVLRLQNLCMACNSAHVTITSRPFL
jgi:TPP-dependent pyruvate/acetoin dehydrogenase alpha subunit